MTRNPQVIAILRQALALEAHLNLQYRQRLAHFEIHGSEEDRLRRSIQMSVEAGDETTAEKLRHIQERHEKAIGWLEQQLRLIQMVGGEAEYIEEKL